MAAIRDIGLGRDDNTALLLMNEMFVLFAACVARRAPELDWNFVALGIVAYGDGVVNGDVAGRCCYSIVGGGFAFGGDMGRGGPSIEERVYSLWLY